MIDSANYVSVVDYEYGDMNYREYDIANHFVEFVGIGDEETGFLDYEKYYPDQEYQVEWIKQYLGPNGGGDDSAARQLQKLVDKFSPLPNLLWGIWALIQSKNSNIDFDFLDYAKQRLDFYRKRSHLATEK